MLYQERQRVFFGFPLLFSLYCVIKKLTLSHIQQISSKRFFKASRQNYGNSTRDILIIDKNGKRSGKWSRFFFCRNNFKSRLLDGRPIASTCVKVLDFGDKQSNPTRNNMGREHRHVGVFNPFQYITNQQQTTLSSSMQII